MQTLTEAEMPGTPVNATSVDFDPFAIRTDCTEAQKEVWAGVQMGQAASCAFNESITLRLHGELKEAALQSAILALVNRHEALRMTFSADGETFSVGETLPDLQSLSLEKINLRNLEENVRREQWNRIQNAEVDTAFDLERGPLFRIKLVQMKDQEQLLVFTAHHIICDGWSIGILVRDLAALYTAAVTGKGSDLPPPDRFIDYAEELQIQKNSAEAMTAEAFWLLKFSGDIPVLDLPTDFVRPALKTYASKRIDFELNATVAQEIRKVGAKAGCSFVITLLAAFEVLLHRLTGQEDLVVGIPTAGQSVAGKKNLVGHGVHLLPLRNSISGDLSFLSHLKNVKTAMLDSYDHQQLTFGSLLRLLPIARDASRLPLVSVQFNIDPGIDGAKLDFRGLEVELFSNPRNFENFELFLNAVDDGRKVVLECQFNTDLFSAETVLSRLQSLEVILAGAAANPESRIADLPVLTAQDQKRLLKDWNATAADFSSTRGVHELFEDQVTVDPFRAAAVCGNQSITYGELDARANQLARHLQSFGAGEGSLVALLLDRSIEMLISMLAVLKSGAAYLPLDPDYPEDRVSSMLQDSAASILLSRTSLLDRHFSVLPGASSGKLTIVDLDLNVDVLQKVSATPVPGSKNSERPAYVIYTSGSTGQPKGVVVPHRAVVNFLESMAREPGITSSDTLLAVTTLSFDIAVLELYLPLTVGARTILVERETAVDGAKLLALLKQTQATLLQATPSTWRMLLAAGLNAQPQLKALCGGEALSADLASPLLDRVGSLWNMFGPTETAVWSTCARMEKGSPITIGRPIANTEIYLLDTRMGLAPIGVAGELYIGGAGLAQGYLNRPELTAERFVAHPFSPGQRLYRTGDLARYRTDGQIEYLGRNDHQVKVRGHRIELGEIEVAIATAPGIRQCVVIVREDRPGDARIVAYFVKDGAQGLSEVELRQRLSSRLPAYMVPQHFVELQKLPMTQNLKFDRKALPAPVTDTVESVSAAEIQPETAVQLQLSQIWQNILGRQRIGLDANFFNLGGHSLLATQVMARVREEFKVELSLRHLFEAPTLAQLSQLIENQKQDQQNTGNAWSGPVRLTHADAPPLTLMQQRLWYLEQLNPGTAVYNLPAAFRLVGALDSSALNASLNAMIARHGSLRTTLDQVSGVPVQIIAPELLVDLQPVDLTLLPEVNREAEVQRLTALEGARPFELSQLPLFRVQLYALSSSEHVLFFMPHHAIFDGWSFDVFLRELRSFYAAFTQGTQAVLPELPVQYSDYAVWQKDRVQGNRHGRELNYWSHQLSGDLPVLEIPSDRVRPPVMSFRGAAEEFSLSASLVQKLTELARTEGATLHMVLLSAFKTLLFRYSGLTDLIVGSPVQGRSFRETEDLIGFFVNTLALRTRLSGDESSSPMSVTYPSFREVLKRVRETCLDAYAHQEMPFETLVEELKPVRDLSRTPVFQAFFTYQDVTNREWTLGDLEIRQFNVQNTVSPTDLSLWVKETGKGVTGAMDYSSDLFDPETIQAFLAQYAALLESVARAPETSIDRLEILSQEEKNLLKSWNETSRHFAPDSTVHALLEQQARISPDAIAVQSAGSSASLTYSELQSRAGALARILISEGVTPGSLVGLCVDRTPDLLVALLGILKAGGAYVPLDPEYPADRLEHMIQDSGMSVLITQTHLYRDLPPSVSELGTVLQLDQLPGFLSGTETKNSNPSEGDASSQESLPIVPLESPAYVIYTSGSTGKPKGVVVPHRAVVNFLLSMKERPGIQSRDALLALTTLSFDIAALELLLPLVVGAQVVIATREQASDGAELKRLIETHAISILQATPSTWRFLLASGWKAAGTFKVLCGGEALSQDLARDLITAAGSVWNMYGPTETTVWSTCSEVTDASKPVVIGRPIANTQAHVLDAHLNPVPVGVPGELHIGGSGVTTGYLHRPELTCERYILDPMDLTGKSRLYRTGDLVRFRRDGNLEYQRRNDQQVKVRGHRIELGEIEARLQEHSSVQQSVVLVREIKAGDVRLIAYLQPVAGQEIEPLAIRKFLRGVLPEYMIPQLIMELQSLPQTPNGKLDRKALPLPPEWSTQSQRRSVPPRSAAEKFLGDLWVRTLGLASVGVDDNFFDLGGHSLLSMQVISQVEKSTGVKLNPRLLLLNSLEQISNLLPEVISAEAAEVSSQDSRSLAKRVLGRLTSRWAT